MINQTSIHKYITDKLKPESKYKRTLVSVIDGKETPTTNPITIPIKVAMRSLAPSLCLFIPPLIKENITS